jgi:hypothetical protein
VRKGLRKISYLTFFDWIIFLLGQQAHVIADVSQPFEHLNRIFMPTLTTVVVRHPKGAGQKRSFAMR